MMMSPFSMWISQDRQCAGEWVYEMVCAAPADFWATFMMPARIDPSARFFKVPHGGRAHFGRKAAPVFFLPVRRIDYNNTCHRLSPHPIGNAEPAAGDNERFTVGM
jgi:hypothetical protein